MNQTLANAARLGLLVLAAVAVMAVMLFAQGSDAPAVALDTVADNDPAVAHPQSGPAGFPDGEVAGAPPPVSAFPNFSISRGGECDTNGDNKKCVVPPGGSFEVDFLVEDVGTVIANETYNYVAIRLDYSWNLTVKKPPVAFPGSPCDDTPITGAGSMNWTDAEDDIGIPINEFWIWCDPAPWTTYAGQMFSVTFNCPPFKSKETITLANVLPGGFYGFQSGTALQNANGNVWIAEYNRNETLVINCDNYYPWDVVGPGQSATLDGIVDLPNDILAVIQHFCPLTSMPCAKPTPVP